MKKRHCERSEAIQWPWNSVKGHWIASALPRNDGQMRNDGQTPNDETDVSKWPVVGAHTKTVICML